MKTIIVPVDFSATAATAAEFAGNLAVFYNADLWLYHSYKLPVMVSGFTVSTIKEETQAMAEEDMNVFKKIIQSKLRFALSIRTKTEHASLHDGLPAFCNRIKPDMVVMGFSRKSGLANLFTGSNTLWAVHELNWPVLVIPPDTNFAPIRKIGFACNYDKVLYNLPIATLEKIVKDLNAELHIIDVHAHNKPYNEMEVLEGVFVNELLKERKPEYHTIDAENVTKGIGSFVEEGHLDWIAAIPKEHTAMDKMFKHSHTKDLLYHTHVPVLCVHE